MPSSLEGTAGRKPEAPWRHSESRFALSLADSVSLKESCSASSSSFESAACFRGLGSVSGR
eukprot:4460409-Karenia_brevis.AAC.1